MTPHCWEWEPGERVTGYGVFTVRTGRQALAHRLSYEICQGEEPPKGLVVRHRCDNRLCVNPDHLLLGTHADNVRDRVERGRGVRGERSPAAKLSLDQVRLIRSTPDGFGRRMAQALGVSATTISKIRNGRAWSHALS